MATARRSAGSLAAILVVVLTATPAVAQLYRWTDGSGKEHFTSDPSQVPAQQRQPALAPGQGSGGRLNVIESSPAASSTSALGGGTKAPAAAASASEKIGGADEASWRTRVVKIREEIATLEARDTECKRHPPGVPGRLDSVNGYTVNRRQLERAEANVDDCREASSQLAYKRVELEHLEERARVAGVPPGWLR
jgi:hypothetical protein